MHQLAHGYAHFSYLCDSHFDHRSTARFVRYVASKRKYTCRHCDMNQLESAFGGHDGAPSNSTSSPVVIIGENPGVWLGPNYDKDKNPTNEKQKEGVASWEMVNEQIRQNMAGNVRVLKEMVSGLERGQTRMDMFGTTTDKLHQKIHILTDRVVALESFASTITPTIKRSYEYCKHTCI